ncbi:MAG: IS21 family transposase [Chloroflexota bacterium]|nr:IS21 family transposase [Chloroflexota bacterium]
MIPVEERAVIRHAYYLEDKPIRQIARERNVARQTVRKALQSADPTPSPRATPRPAPVLGPFKAQLDALLGENDRLPRKQRYTTHKMFTLIQAAGYRGSQSHVRAYIGQQRRTRQRPALFLPLEFDPGQDAQVDWGEAIAILAGEQITCQLFVMRLCYSRRTFAMAFPTQRQEAFFEGHVHAFHHFQGVPRRLSYDNLTTAVKPLLVGRTRQEQQAFTVFRSHYLFDAHFCTPGQGHEKGGVEHGVGYVRRNFLVPIPEVESFAELNVLLLQACLQDDQRQVQGQPTPIGAAWAAEQPALRPLPRHDFDCCITVTAALTPYSQVVFETNRYSVPVDRATAQLTLKAYPFRIEILAQEQMLASHPRCYGRDQDVFDPLHYLALLEQRPGAFEHAKPLRRWRDRWPLVYTRLLYLLRHARPDGSGVREFVRILRLHLEYPAPVIEQAITMALESGCPHEAGVRLCLYQVVHPETPPPVLDLAAHPQLGSVGTQPINLARYDQLLVGGH